MKKTKLPTKDNHFLCAKCDGIALVGQVIRGKVYCSKHAKELLAKKEAKQ